MSTTSALVIRDAEINGVPAMDCRIEGGRIVELGHALRPGPRDDVLDGHGGALIPGLADHHIHLTALAAWRASLDLTDIPPDAVADALRSAHPDAGGWVRAVGYDDTVHGDLTRDSLDSWLPTVPLRVQHRSGALWVLNSTGLAVLSAETSPHPGIEREPAGRPTGRIWRADDWLRDRLPSRPPSLRAIGRELASYGITHIADATPDADGTVARLLADAVENEDLLQHLAVMSAVPPQSRHHRLTAGPVKLIVADHQAPDLNELTDGITAAHAHGRPVAVHCVSRPALALTLAALEHAGGHDGDRIEHCAVTDLATAQVLAQRRIRVVTQPTLVTRRGDIYRQHADDTDREDLWRYATLLHAGVTVAPSSDAPYGDPDPWACLRAATSRRTCSGHTLGPHERVSADIALAGMQSELDDPGGRPRTVRPSAPADLVLLDRPLRHALRDPGPGCVRATIIDGRPVP